MYLTDKMKRSFFRAAVVSILLYGCTTWTLTKRLEKKLDSNYTRMLRAILNKSWRQHPTRHAGHCWRSKYELISDVLLWTTAYGQAKAGQPARTYSSYVRIRDVALKTCQRRWMIGRSGEIGSGISVLAVRHDDDDDIYMYMYSKYIYIYIYKYIHIYIVIYWQCLCITTLQCG